MGLAELLLDKWETKVVRVYTRVNGRTEKESAKEDLYMMKQRLCFMKERYGTVNLMVLADITHLTSVILGSLSTVNSKGLVDFKIKN